MRRARSEHRPGNERLLVCQLDGRGGFKKKRNSRGSATRNNLRAEQHSTRPMGGRRWAAAYGRDGDVKPAAAAIHAVQLDDTTQQTAGPAPGLQRLLLDPSTVLPTIAHSGASKSHHRRNGIAAPGAYRCAVCAPSTPICPPARSSLMPSPATAAAPTAAAASQGRAANCSALRVLHVSSSPLCPPGPPAVSGPLSLRNRHSQRALVHPSAGPPRHSHRSSLPQVIAKHPRTIAPWNSRRALDIAH